MPPNTRPSFKDEITSSHVYNYKLQTANSKLQAANTIITSIEILKRQNKKCGKDEVSELVKDSLEEAITMESFEKPLALL